MALTRWSSVLVLPVLLSGTLLLSACREDSDTKIRVLRARLEAGEQAEVKEEARKLSMEPPRTAADRLPLARLLIDVDLARLAVTILAEERLNPEARDVLALAYLRTGDRVRATMLLDKQAAVATESALTHRIRAEMLLAGRSWREARAAVNKAILRDPDDPWSSVLLAGSHLQEGDLPTAEKVLRDAHRRFPQDPVVAGELAEVVLTAHPGVRGAAEEAVSLWRQATERLPLREGYRERLSVALLAIQDYRGAKKVLLGLTEQWPENPQHWNRLGLVLRESGDLEGAVAAFERSVRCGTDEGRDRLVVYFNLGNAQLEMADRTEEREKWGKAAWRVFKAAEAIAPQDARVYIGLAKATVEMDPTGEQIRAAIQIYERAIELTKLGPYPPEVVHEPHLNVALLYVDLWIKDPEAETEGRRKALSHMREAEKLVPTDRWHRSAVMTYEELKGK